MIQHSSIPVNLSTLIEDSTHRVVTDAEKADWNTKQNALSFGNLTTSTGLTITGGTGSVIGSGTSIKPSTGYFIPTTAEKADWDEAYSLEHSHSNKTNLDNINQDLGTSNNVAFNSVTTDLAQFDTSTGNPVHAEGKVFYDYAKHALSYYNEESDITVNIAQENLIRVRNETGSKILNGTVVYPIGITGTEVLIDLANSHDKETCRLTGVVTHDIETGSVGYVCKFGEVGDLDTHLFLTGELVYLNDSIPGKFTNVKPTAGGSYAVVIGAVKKSGTTDGSIIVDINTSEFSLEQSKDLGWSPEHTATLSFVDTDANPLLSRTLHITPVYDEYDFYQYGDKYSKTSDSIQLPDEEGLYVIYYNLGTLYYFKNPTDAQIDTIIRNNPYAAYVYWNAVNKKSEYVGLEMHKLGMTPPTHAYLHFNFRCRWSNGLAPNTISADGSGDLDAHAQFGMDSGAITDEDLYHSTPTILSTTGLPIYYLSGTYASPTLRGTTNAGFSVLTTGSGRLAYNTVSAGNYILSEVPNLDFVCYHIIAVNENNINRRVISLVGQTSYTSLANARAGAITEIENVRISGIVPQEVKAIATFIFQTGNTYANAVKGRIRTVATGVYYVDWRNTQIAGGAGSSIGSTVFNDSLFQIYDNTDVTKILQFQVSNISSGTTSVLSAPNSDGTIIISEGVNGYQTIRGGLTSTGSLNLYNNAIDNQGIVITSTGNVGIGIDITTTTTSKLQVVGLPSYEDNDTAISDGLTTGAFYRTSTGIVKVVF